MQQAYGPLHPPLAEDDLTPPHLVTLPGEGSPTPPPPFLASEVAWDPSQPPFSDRPPAPDDYAGGPH